VSNIQLGEVQSLLRGYLNAHVDWRTWKFWIVALALGVLWSVPASSVSRAPVNNELSSSERVELFQVNQEREKKEQQKREINRLKDELGM